MSVRRNIKNVVYNYSEAARKVREATSNDPWGPSTSLMQNISELTYNMVAFSEVMAIVWKRLNDHGRNWRHVYKSLVLLDYLVKYGSRRVSQQCKENIFAIQTLKDFQYIEDNKDQGLNVREKAKQLVALLKDDERLKNERAKAEALRQRFNQEHGGCQPIGYDQQQHGRLASGARGSGASGAASVVHHHHHHQPHQHESTSFPGYDGSPYVASASAYDPPAHIRQEYARPENAEEEALQVQLALALSKQEADEEESRRKTDFVKLSMAVSESLRGGGGGGVGPPPPQQQQKSLLHDTGKHASENDIIGLFDAAWSDQQQHQTTKTMASSPPADEEADWPLLDISAASSSHHPQQQQNRPVSANPWVSQQYYEPATASPTRDVWQSSSTPWEPITGSARRPADDDDEEDPWGLPTNAVKPDAAAAELGDLFHPAQPAAAAAAAPLSPSFDYYNLTGSLQQQPKKQTPEDFLGEHKDLVNLDDLAAAAAAAADDERSKNPFLAAATSAAAAKQFTAQNPFAAAAAAATQPRGPTLNQLSAAAAAAAAAKKPNPFA